jgi:hypothetical protein
MSRRICPGKVQAFFLLEQSLTQENANLQRPFDTPFGRRAGLGIE